MNGFHLKFYVYQYQKHHGVLVYEWLLEKAKSLNYRGGTAILSMAGFGHDHKMHEGHFFEISGGNLPMEVGFALTEEQAEHFLTIIKKENLDIFYVKSSIVFGTTQEKK